MEMAYERLVAPDSEGQIYLSPELERDIQHRLSRIEGHVRGIGRMLDEHQECDRQVIIKLLESHIEMCRR